MRAILVVAILLLGLAGATPESDYSAFGDNIRGDRDSALDLVEIESVHSRGDRLSLAALEQPRLLRIEVLRPEDRDSPLKLASLHSDEESEADTDLDFAGSMAPQPNGVASQQGGQKSLDDLCNTLFTSAQDNDLPVPFFANLLWQESRLREHEVSKKGALGIAQFMPKVAAETGLADPFDPMQAIPASARFLQRLRLQFGNLGFVAAAYNAGAHRVIEWLQRRVGLPRETRDYVVRVTGLSVEAWRKIPIDNDALAFVPHLPCRSLPAFANVEQEYAQLSELERAKYARMESEQELDASLSAVSARRTTTQTRDNKHAQVRGETRRFAHAGRGSKHEAASAGHADRGSKREAASAAHTDHAAKHEVASAAHEGHRSKHEAAHLQRSNREKRKSA
jgi:transglycosylase-like protein with SLT domain